MRDIGGVFGGFFGGLFHLLLHLMLATLHYQIKTMLLARTMFNDLFASLHVTRRVQLFLRS